MKMKVVCLVLLSVLVSCQAKESGEYNLETSAKDKTVAGQDENKNGVRDDVEAELKKQYTGKVLDTALKHACAMQGFLTVNQEDRAAMWKATMEMGQRTHCLYTASDTNSASRLVFKIRGHPINYALQMDMYVASNNTVLDGSYGHDD